MGIKINGSWVDLMKLGIKINDSGKKAGKNIGIKENGSGVQLA